MVRFEKKQAEKLMRDPEYLFKSVFESFFKEHFGEMDLRRSGKRVVFIVRWLKANK